MSSQDLVIAKALNAGLRRLIVAAFVHQKVAEGSEGTTRLLEALEREIRRLAVRGSNETAEDADLTEAVRKSLKLILSDAYREASTRSIAPSSVQ